MGGFPEGMGGGKVGKFFLDPQSKSHKQAESHSVTMETKRK
jgi:hypothetical protein